MKNEIFGRLPVLLILILGLYVLSLGPKCHTAELPYLKGTTKATSYLTLDPMCHTDELPYLKGTTKATLCLALQLAGLAFPPTLKEQ
jgi:hypothetical protein